MRRLRQLVRHFLGRLLLGWAARLLLPAAPPRRRGSSNPSASPGGAVERLAREQAAADELAIAQRARSAEADAAQRAKVPAPSSSRDAHVAHVMPDAPAVRAMPAGAPAVAKRAVRFGRIVHRSAARTNGPSPAAERETAVHAAAAWTPDTPRRARTPTQAAGGRAGGRSERASAEIASSPAAAAVPQTPSRPPHAAPDGTPVVGAHREWPAPKAPRRGDEPVGAPRAPFMPARPVDSPSSGGPVRRGRDGGAGRASGPQRWIIDVRTRSYAGHESARASAGDRHENGDSPSAVQVSAAPPLDASRAMRVRAIPAEPPRSAGAPSPSASPYRDGTAPSTPFSSGRWPPLPGEDGAVDESRWPSVPELAAAWGGGPGPAAAPPRDEIRANRLRDEQRGVRWSG